MQKRSSDDNSVCLSVCPSVCKRVDCDKTEERSVQIFIPYGLSIDTDLDDLEWPWMAWNGVIALILRFSPNWIALLANYVTVVEDRPGIMSVNIVSQFQSSTFGHNWPTLQRGLSAIVELLVLITDNSLNHSFSELCLTGMPDDSYPNLFVTRRFVLNSMAIVSREERNANCNQTCVCNTDTIIITFKGQVSVSCRCSAMSVNVHFTRMKQVFTGYKARLATVISILQSMWSLNTHSL